MQTQPKQSVQNKLCSWILTTRITWFEPKQDFKTKAHIHLPDDIKKQINSDELDTLLDVCSKQADALETSYKDALFETNLVWGIANWYEIQHQPVSDAFEKAIKHITSKYPDIIKATKQLYIKSIYNQEIDNIYQQFLTLIADAIIKEHKKGVDACEQS